jgi:RNA polymerase sigma factor (sigma-70 family)
MNDDVALLRCYVEEGSETAFRELVGRYLDLVYAAAMRRTQGDSHQAADIAQTVFTALAHQARRLVGHPALGAWLHTATRNAAINLVKTEQRRRSYEASAALDLSSPPEPQPTWDYLRPLLDQAIDQLAEKDRTIIVLRFLEQRAYTQIGTALRLTEDASRMRTERALDKLRRILSRRGITSTTGALGLVLAQQTLSAAPSGLAASLSTTALAAAPTSAAGLGSLFLMSKLTSASVVAALTVGVTTLIWVAFAGQPGSREITALRAENRRLLDATAPKASSEVVAAVADDFENTATAISRLVRQKQSRANAGGVRTTLSDTNGKNVSATTSSGHRNRGQATPFDSQMTFAWASDTAEVKVLSGMIFFDGDSRKEALEVLAAMPDSIRAEYPTPEELYAFFLVAQTQLEPPPGPDILEQKRPIEVSPGRVKFLQPGQQEPRYWDWAYQSTDSGWKLVIIPDLIPVMAQSVMKKEFFTEIPAAKP